MPMSRPPLRRGSVARIVIGALLCLVAIVLSVYGFLHLAGVLAGGGYGTPAVRTALIILGTSGAFLATGIAVIIWDISLRYERD